MERLPAAVELDGEVLIGVEVATPGEKTGGEEMGEVMGVLDEWGIGEIGEIGEGDADL